MKILLFAQHYAPEEVSGAVLATELAVDLVRRGHEVTFVTGAPNYPEGIVFPGYQNRFLSEEILEGVRVIRVWSFISPTRRFWQRILNFGTFSLMAVLGGLKAGRPEVIFSYSPPLPLGMTAWLVSRLRGVPWVLRVEDIYPEAAVAVGILRNRMTIRFFELVERFIYQKAAHISVISEGFRKNLVGKKVPAEKLSVSPVWADPDSIRPAERHNAFRNRLGLENRFVVMYAGTMGLTSALEDVLLAAVILQDNPEICFVLVGDGIKNASLHAFAAEHKLTNCMFLPFQPRAQFPEVMAAADIHLVTLNPASSPFSMPNKVYNIMASGRPILAVTPQESEVAELVEQHHCGWVTPPGHPQQLAEAIVKISQQSADLDTFGENGRIALEKYYPRVHCIDLFEKTLLNAAQ